MTPSQRFQLGDQVEVVEAFRYGEWLRVPLFVSGVRYSLATGEPDYTVSEHWPPRDNGDLTDGFREDDLQPRFRTRPTGLMVCKDCGTDRMKAACPRGSAALCPMTGTAFAVSSLAMQSPSNGGADQ